MPPINYLKLAGDRLMFDEGHAHVPGLVMTTRKGTGLYAVFKGVGVTKSALIERVSNPAACAQYGLANVQTLTRHNQVELRWYPNPYWEPGSPVATHLAIVRITFRK